MVSDSRRERAIDLRVAGLSRSQIKEALGVRSSKMLNAWLRGTPPPEWTERPNAKDDVRAHALAMRIEGRSYNEIRRELGVSKSTLSLWLRDVPLTEAQAAALKDRPKVASVNRGLAIAARNQRRRDAITAAARDEITELSERELFIAGLVAYWAEGSKSKPWRPISRTSFINSDPAMIRLFLAWLRLLGIGMDRMIFRVTIHASADAEAAVRYWADVVGAMPEQFRKTTLKRHNPKTIRKNVDATYHGCVIVTVRRSSDLNLMIAGWFEGLAAAADTMIRTSGMV